VCPPERIEKGTEKKERTGRAFDTSSEVSGVKIKAAGSLALRDLHEI
jgi:hypothetical protein